VFTGAEADILVNTDNQLAQLGAGLLVTWNGAGFDLPYVARRAEMLGIELGLDLTDDPRRRSTRDPQRRSVRGSWHDLIHLDGYLLYRADVGRSLGISCGLKPLARFVGLEPVELDRRTLHLASQEQVAEYVASDARMATALVRRRMPAARSAADFPPPRIPDLRAADAHVPSSGRSVREAGAHR
jgi:hypothetical protein